jgi:hypothetical protein
MGDHLVTPIPQLLAIDFAHINERGTATGGIEFDAFHGESNQFATARQTGRPHDTAIVTSESIVLS